jgi:cell division protein FtsA
MEEIFNLGKEKMDALALPRPLGGGVVLTGGGALLTGAAELAYEVFRLPVRIGTPLSVGGLVDEYRSPLYATGLGLVLEGALREQSGSLIDSAEESGVISDTSFFARLRRWLKEFF